MWRFFCDKRHREIESPLLFIVKPISMCIQTQCWCTECYFKINGEFFYCQCGKRRFSHFMSDSCQTPWQIMHVLTFLFKMRVLENAGKLMNHGITRYSYMGRDSSVLPRFIEERQLRPERYICKVTYIERCLYIRDYIVDVYTLYFVCILPLHIIKESHI